MPVAVPPNARVASPDRSAPAPSRAGRRRTLTTLAGVAISEVTIETSRGPARVTVHLPPGPSAERIVVVLHGAGTDSSRSPLPELCDELAGSGILAVRFDQPYRVA